jgi:predicted GNAT family N-acyltransferase
MEILINKIIDKSQMQKAWDIRRVVFVIEQECPEELEWEFEEESTHYLALLDGKAVGTARWRRTENGFKLERFAVLKEARNSGVGSSLVKHLLNELSDQTEKKYLHAQLAAAPLYAKHGFKPEGENFWEAGIEHVKMSV